MLRQLRALGRNLDLIVIHFAGYGPLLEAEARACASAFCTRIALFVIAGACAQIALIAAAFSLTLCLAHLAAWHWAIFAVPLAALFLALVALGFALGRKPPSISATLKDQLARDMALFRAMTERRDDAAGKAP